MKEKIHPLVESHRFEEAVQLCNDTDTALSQVVKKAIECKTWPEDNIKEVVSIEIDKVIPNLEHSLTPLGTIDSI